MEDHPLFSALYIKPSFLAKIVLKLFSILSFWTRKVDLQSFTKEWKNWQKCKLDFHVRNAQYKDLPYCFSTLYSKKQWPMKLSNYYCSNLSLLPFWQKDHLKYDFKMRQHFDDWPWIYIVLSKCDKNRARICDKITLIFLPLRGKIQLCWNFLEKSYTFKLS